MLEEAGSTTKVYYLNFNFRSTTNKCELPTYVFNCRQADKSDGQIGRQRQKQITNTQRETNAQTDRGRVIDRHAGRETDTN